MAEYDQAACRVGQRVDVQDILVRRHCRIAAAIDIAGPDAKRIRQRCQRLVVARCPRPVDDGQHQPFDLRRRDDRTRMDGSVALQAGPHRPIPRCLQRGGDVAVDAGKEALVVAMSRQRRGQDAARAGQRIARPLHADAVHGPATQQAACRCEDATGTRVLQQTLGIGDHVHQEEPQRPVREVARDPVHAAVDGKRWIGNGSIHH
jgi:hypothetical protein